MHGSFAHVQLDLVQRVNAGEPLGDALHPENMLAHLAALGGTRQRERAGGDRSLRSRYFFMNDL